MPENRETGEKWSFARSAQRLLLLTSTWSAIILTNRVSQTIMIDSPRYGTANWTLIWPSRHPTFKNYAATVSARSVPNPTINISHYRMLFHFATTSCACIPTLFINPRCVCAARVKVLGLCVCLCVCVSVTRHLTFHVFIRATNDTNLRIPLCTDFLMRKKLRVYPKFRF